MWQLVLRSRLQLHQLIRIVFILVHFLDESNFNFVRVCIVSSNHLRQSEITKCGSDTLRDEVELVQGKFIHNQDVNVQIPSILALVNHELIPIDYVSKHFL